MAPRRGRGAELNALRKKKQEEKTGVKTKPQSSVSQNTNRNGGGRTGGITRQQVAQKVRNAPGYTSSGKAKRPASSTRSTTRNQSTAQSKPANPYATKRNIINRSNSSTAQVNTHRSRINPSSAYRGRTQQLAEQRQKKNPVAATAKEMIEQRKQAADEQARSRMSRPATAMEMRQKRAKDLAEKRGDNIPQKVANKAADLFARPFASGVKEAAASTGSWINKALATNTVANERFARQNGAEKTEWWKKHEERTQLRDEALRKRIDREKAVQEELVNRQNTQIGKFAVQGSASAGGMVLDQALGPMSLVNMGFRSRESQLGDVKKKVEPLKRQMLQSGNYTQREIDEIFKDVDKWDEANATIGGLVEALSETVGAGFGPMAKYVGGAGLLERTMGNTISKLTARPLGKFLVGFAEEAAEESPGKSLCLQKRRYYPEGSEP